MKNRYFAYGITFFDCAYKAWEWLFLFYVSFIFIGFENGGIWTGILFMTNSLVRIFLANILAKYSSLFKNENSKFKTSLAVRIIILLTLSLLPMIGNYPVFIFIWAVFANILFVYDSYLTLNLCYRFADSGDLAIVQLNSMQNLGRRGTIAITSYLGFVLSKTSWINFSISCALFVVCGVIGSLLSIHYISLSSKKSLPSENNLDVKQRKASAKKIQTSILIEAAFLFILNLMFGSFLMLMVRSIEKYSLVFFGNITLLTFFYTGFILIMLVGIKIPKSFERVTHLKFLTWLCLSISLSGVLIPLFRTYPITCCFFALINGFIYGASLLIFSNLILKKVRGENQEELYSKVDSSGRLGFMLTQLGTGFLLDRAFDPLDLMNIYSILSVPALLIFIFLYKRNLGKVDCYAMSAT